MSEPALATPQKRLGTMLLEGGLLTEEQIDQAVEDAKRLNQRLGQYLVDQGLVSAEDIAQTLSRQLNVPLIDLKRQEIDPQALELVPQAYARRYDLIPIEVTGDKLVVVMADPGNIRVLEDLKSQSHLSIEPAVGIPHDIREAVNQNYRASDEIAEQISRVAPSTAEKELEEAALPPDLLAQTPVVRTVDLIIGQAVRDRASDIHLEPQEDNVRIRYRIDGILHETQTLPLSVHSALVSRLKVLAGMNIAERRRPQDGQFSVQIEDKSVDFRVASSDSAHGEMVVLRVLDKSLSLFELAELGHQPEVFETFSEMLRTPFGMILVGGPTGSGKTTTLYASVNQLDRKRRNIITIEDPIEYHFPGINQIQVNPRAEMTFAAGLRSLMRLDPDVILVGEVRDGETARIAIQAALTGHLVLSSIHANDSVGVLFRLMDLGIEPFLISSALVGVASQRMIRRICPRCREPAETTPEAERAYKEEMGESPPQLYRGAGCNFCAGTGHLGRAGVFEVIKLSEEVRRMLVGGASSEEIKAQARSEGMITMRRDGMLKVKQGVTTTQEVIANVFSIL